MRRTLMMVAAALILSGPAWAVGGAINALTVTKTSAYANFVAFTASGTTTAVSVSLAAPFLHTVQVVVTGGPATCTIQLEGTLNGTTWYVMGAAQTCTSTITFYPVWVGAQTIRVNLTALTGGASPTVTVYYQGTGGSGVALSSRIVGLVTDTGFSTTQASANILAATVASTQTYRVGYNLWQVTSGSAGTCSTNATATVTIGFTNPANQAQTITVLLANLQPTLGAGTPGFFQGTTLASGAISPTGYQSAEFTIATKASTAITRTITWANGNCTNQPTASAIFYAEVVN